MYYLCESLATSASRATGRENRLLKLPLHFLVFLEHFFSLPIYFHFLDNWFQKMAEPLKIYTRTSLHLIKSTVFSLVVHLPHPANYPHTHKRNNRVPSSNRAFTTHLFLSIPQFILSSKCLSCHAQSYCILLPRQLPDFYTFLPKIPSALFHP